MNGIAAALLATTSAFASEAPMDAGSLAHALDRLAVTGRVLYVASLALLLVSLFAKAWGIVLPAVLVVLDFHPLRRAEQNSLYPLF